MHALLGGHACSPTAPWEIERGKVDAASGETGPARTAERGAATSNQARLPVAKQLDALKHGLSANPGAR